MAIFGQRLNRIDLFAGNGGKRYEATIHRTISCAVNARLHKQHRAGSALAFRAAFLRTGKAAPPEVI
jgi:hypothetical protein